VCAVGGQRECSLRIQQCDTNSETCPFPQRFLPLSLPSWPALSVAALQTVLGRPGTQQSQQTRNQSQKARAGAGGIEAGGVGTGRGRGCCPPPPHALPPATQTPQMLRCSCGTILQKSLSIKSQGCLAPPPHTRVQSLPRVVTGVLRHDCTFLYPWEKH